MVVTVLHAYEVTPPQLSTMVVTVLHAYEVTPPQLSTMVVSVCGFFFKYSSELHLNNCFSFTCKTDGTIVGNCSGVTSYACKTVTTIVGNCGCGWSRHHRGY